MSDFNLTPEELQEFAALAKKSTFIKNDWTTIREFTPKQASIFFPKYKYIPDEGLASVIEKVKLDGKGTFCKMLVPLATGKGAMEEELSYNHTFHKGQKIMIHTLKICIEENAFGERHLYITGTVIE